MSERRAAEGVERAERPEPRPPRYGRRPFPRYAYRPGTDTPHPRRHPEGHAYGAPDPAPPPVCEEAWRENGDWLHAVDLYNAGYYWECHELLEGLWNAAGRRSETGRLLRALVQVAGAALKRAQGESAGARRLAAKALGTLESASGPALGLDVPAFARAVRVRLLEGRGAPPALQLSD